MSGPASHWPAGRVKCNCLTWVAQLFANYCRKLLVLYSSRAITRLLVCLSINTIPVRPPTSTNICVCIIQGPRVRQTIWETAISIWSAELCSPARRRCTAPRQNRRFLARLRFKLSIEGFLTTMTRAPCCFRVPDQKPFQCLSSGCWIVVSPCKGITRPISPSAFCPKWFLPLQISNAPCIKTHAQTLIRPVPPVAFRFLPVGVWVVWYHLLELHFHFPPQPQQK